MKTISAVLLVAAHLIASAEEANDRNPLICDQPILFRGHEGNNRVATINFSKHDGVWYHWSGSLPCEPTTCVDLGQARGAVSSSNRAVAFVDPKGTIQPVGIGITTLTIGSADSAAFVYVEVSKIESARADSDRLRGFDFVDWTSHVGITRGRVLEDSPWASTYVLTLTNLGNLPLRSDDTVLQIGNLPSNVAPVKVCPGTANFSKAGEIELQFQKEFLLPGESQEFSVVFVNTAKKPINFNPKVLRAQSVLNSSAER